LARPFLSEFLLPLVKGGTLHVGRPLGRAALERMAPILIAADRLAPAGDGAPPPTPAQRAADELGRRRRLSIAELLPVAAPPPLDETTLRLGAAVHNLLALGHPELSGRGHEARQDRIAAAALDLASVGAPATVTEAANRHSLLARLPEIGRSDRTVHFWIGRRTFIGRVPPRRLTALPRLRSVRVDLVRRGWLREIGIPAAGRAAFVALNVASPLGEALDPLRLEPPLSWGRILPVLRFPPLCRAVAGRALEVGLDRAGDAFADALFRFASAQEPPGGIAPTAGGVGFAIQFLAHVAWLDLLFGRGRRAAEAPVVGGDESDAGLDLATLLVAAARVSQALVWPHDLPRDGDLGRAFAARLGAMAARVERRRPPRFDAAVAVAQGAFVAPPAGASAPPPFVA
jgi:hypothetical protein